MTTAPLIAFSLAAAFAAAGAERAEAQDRRPARDTARAPADTGLRRPVTLPTVRTEAPRTERKLFEDKPNVGVVTISRRERATAPRFFAEADVLRALQLMPGVEARNDYSTGMNVRGGEADQNLILLDGYPIYNPFHFGGLFGTFIDPAVDRIDLYTGAFPAAYGGRLSSVFDVRSAEETRSGVHGTSELSLVATTLALGGGLGGGKGSWSIAGRRTYADKVVNLVKRDGFPYHFADAQAHFAHTLPLGMRLAATAYAGDDDLDVAPDFGERHVVSWGNRLAGVTLSRTFALRSTPLGRILGDSIAVEQRVSRSWFDLDVRLSGGGLSIRSTVDDPRFGGSIMAISPRHTRSLGYEVARPRLAYAATYPIPLIPAESLAQRAPSVSVYYDELWRPSASWIVQAGARLESLRQPRAAALLPRFSVKYFVNEDLALTAAFGDYGQWVRSLAREDIPLRAVDYWVGGDTVSPMSRARHYVLGVEQWLTPTRSFRVEGFYKRYHDLLEPNPYADVRVRGDEFLAVGGSSYGGDLLVRQLEGGKFSGWLAYTYVLNTRVQKDGLRFFPSQDRRHDLNLVGSWHFPGYVLSARFNLATGTPYTRIIGDFERWTYDPLRQTYSAPGDESLQFLAGPRNGERLPLTQRLDLSVTRRGKLGGVAVTPYFSIMNVYNAPNIFGYVFDYSDAPPTRVSLPQLPVFPTIGLSVSW